jgi:hypothetical protein
MKTYIILIILSIFLISGCVEEKKVIERHVLIKDNQTKEIFRLVVATETNDYFYGIKYGTFGDNSYYSKERYVYMGTW